MIANYHTHTWRCKHASGTERTYVEQAIAAGLKILGFSDHTPYPFPDGHVSGFRMAPEQAEDYFATISGLKQEYAGQIEIHIGVEAEYYPAHFDALLEFLSAYPCEYLLLGQHFTNDETDGVYAGWATDEEAVLARYVDQVLAGMATGRFAYVAHPDLVNWQGSRQVYEGHMTRLCQGAAELGVPLELNFLGLREGRCYPDRDFWRIAGEMGNRAVLGCDAHQPESLNCSRTEAAARALAAEFGVPVLETVPLAKPF